MEATVRSIATQSAIVDGTEFATGAKPALCFRGKTYALGIINDDQEIHSVKISLREHDQAPLLMYGVEEYPVTKFISHMERILQTKPITCDALALIRQWPNTPADFGDPIIEDEPVVARKPKPKKQANCLVLIATEIGIPTTRIRKFLRSAGFTAPYDNEKKIRKALKSYK